LESGFSFLFSMNTQILYHIRRLNHPYFSPFQISVLLFGGLGGHCITRRRDTSPVFLTCYTLAVVYRSINAVLLLDLLVSSVTRASQSKKQRGRDWNLMYLPLLNRLGRCVLKF